MRVLVACEESQAVTKELRRLGHEAYSCDIEPCSGGASGVALTAGRNTASENQMGYGYRFPSMYRSGCIRGKVF